MRAETTSKTRFLDEELEPLRIELHEAATELNRLFTLETFSQRRQHGYEFQDVGVVPGEPGGREEEVWERRRRLLNEAADRVADAFDALVDRARHKTLL